MGKEQLTRIFKGQCLNMFTNSNNQGTFLFIFPSIHMDPRISFSSDFVNIEQASQHESNYKEAPVSSDFAFSVKKYVMIPADEIFSKGMMVPLRDNIPHRPRKMTLRDELLVEDEFEDESPRVTKGPAWWKERLSLKKCHNMSKKCDRNNGVLEKVANEKNSVFVHEEVGLDTNGSQGVRYGGGFS